MPSQRRGRKMIRRSRSRALGGAESQASGGDHRSRCAGRLPAFAGRLRRPAGNPRRIELLPLVFTRPGELRLAEWAEFDLDKAIWTIPASRTKMRREHQVPLCRQALAIFSELKTITGARRLVFPGLRSADRPISENTLNAAMRRLGYAQDEMTAHGFRATASTLLNESGKFSADAIERALAHQDPDPVRRAYARGAFGMSASKWRNGGRTISIRSRRADRSSSFGKPRPRREAQAPPTATGSSPTPAAPRNSDRGVGVESLDLFAPINRFKRSAHIAAIMKKKSWKCGGCGKLGITQFWFVPSRSRRYAGVCADRTAIRQAGTHRLVSACFSDACGCAQNGNF